MGKLGIHTIRVANNTTIDECKNDNYSQTACGFVLEFTDIITIHNVNFENVKYSMGTNIGGWKNSEIRKYVNNDIYNLLPLELKSSIIDTKVISGHGKKDNSNFMTKDKLYLLSSVEVWGESFEDTLSNDLTRQLDYYNYMNVNSYNYSCAIKKYNNENFNWWLRSALFYPEDTYTSSFNIVYKDGENYSSLVRVENGVSPAFRIG